jgi:TldD protein
VTIHADAALPGGAGSFGFDSEGAKAQSFPLMEKGRIVSFLSGRETAAAVGRFSSGSMRSGSWLNPPVPWMTNIILQPGICSLSELAGGIERGLMLDTPRSFGVSPSLRGFAAQAELGWMIEDGVITHMVKNPFYRGNSKAFWSGCDAAASVAHQKNLGLMDKGIAVGHLVVPVRIRGVRVGESR